MIDTAFLQESVLIVSRNLTPNVSAVSLAFEGGHLSLTYYLRGLQTDDDEDERELSAAEIVAAFPMVRSCETHFGHVADRANPPRNEAIIWPFSPCEIQK